MDLLVIKKYAAFETPQMIEALAYHMGQNEIAFNTSIHVRGIIPDLIKKAEQKKAGVPTPPNPTELAEGKAKIKVIAEKLHSVS